MKGDLPTGQQALIRQDTACALYSHHVRSVASAVSLDIRLNMCLTRRARAFVFVFVFSLSLSLILLFCNLLLPLFVCC